MLRTAAIVMRSAVTVGLTIAVMAGLFFLLYSYPFLIFIVAPAVLWLVGMLADRWRQRRSAGESRPSSAQPFEQ